MSNTMYKDRNSVTTIQAIKNQLAATLGIQFEVNKTTTINTKLGILADRNPDKFPKIRYFGIGIKGYANLTSENNIAQPFKPSADECDLYEPIPFRCTLAPLEGTEAEQYRMRRTVTIGGTTYYQYWLKKIQFDNPVVKTTKIVNGVESEYTVNSGNLNPTPSMLYPTALADESAQRIVASVTGVCKVEGYEVTEVINAMYGGDMRRAIISELGMYSGCESVVGKDVCPGFPAGTESTYVQLCNHECWLGQTLSDSTDSMEKKVVFENGSCVVI